MSKISKILARRFDRALCRILARKTHRVARRHGIVSFTFDDFPRSALRIGGDILRHYGARGTYFTAMNLVDSSGPHGDLFLESDLKRLTEQGHELACHTYEHVSCRSIGFADVIRQVQRNASKVARIIDNYQMVSFAYPYGEFGLSAKRALRKRFACCRINLPGINAGYVDLALLRANSIYSAEFNFDSVLQLIKRNADVGGWLIFYTHDVTDAPSSWGCTPEHFEAVVKAASESRSEILSIRNSVGAVIAAWLTGRR